MNAVSGPVTGSVWPVAELGNYGEWMQAEREFRLCQSLRTAVREAETLSAAFTGRVSTNDWNVLVDQMQTILATEGELAFLSVNNWPNWPAMLTMMRRRQPSFETLSVRYDSNSRQNVTSSYKKKSSCFQLSKQELGTTRIPQH